MEQLSVTNLRYLMAIFDLSRQYGAVSSIQVAKKLSVTRPSVAKMLNLLAGKGLVEKELYGKIVLTPEGVQTAESYRKTVEEVAGRIPAMGFDLSEEEIRIAAAALVEALPERLMQ